MESKGFAIRCPHCQEWNVVDDHPRNRVVTDRNELGQILEGLHAANANSRRLTFIHDKLFRCKSPHWICPASYEAFICTGVDKILEYANCTRSWSFPRGFRLFKADMIDRWDNPGEELYYGVLVNTQPIIRRREILLESLVDPRLIRHLITALCLELRSPLVLYVTNVFYPKGLSVPRTYWTPIEPNLAASDGHSMFYNGFCGTCRRMQWGNALKFITDKTAVKPNECPFTASEVSQCSTTLLHIPCKVHDWSHCPYFIEKCADTGPCYNSDLELVQRVAEKWHSEATLRSEVQDRCKAGFARAAFSIAVHDHLVGVAIAGQVFTSPDELNAVEDFVTSKVVGALKGQSWASLQTEVGAIKEEERILIGCELSARRGSGSRFLITPEDLKHKAELVRTNVEEFENIAEANYRVYRARSESAFRQELLGFIESHNNEADFFDTNAMKHVLERMRRFWAFKMALFIRYSFSDLSLSTVAQTCLGETKAFGIAGHYETKVLMKEQPTLPRIYLHRTARGVSYAQHFEELAREIEKIVRGIGITISESVPLAMIFIPHFQEVYTFVFAVRDPEGIHESAHRHPGEVSILCQDAMFETCTEVLRAFFNLKAFADRREIDLHKSFRLTLRKIDSTIQDIKTVAGQLDVVLRDDVEENLSKIPDIVQRAVNTPGMPADLPIEFEVLSQLAVDWAGKISKSREILKRSCVNNLDAISRLVSKQESATGEGARCNVGLKES
jgi:hypothetical protein